MGSLTNLELFTRDEYTLLMQNWRNVSNDPIVGVDKKKSIVFGYESPPIIISIVGSREKIDTTN